MDSDELGDAPLRVKSISKLKLKLELRFEHQLEHPCHEVF